MAKPAVAAWIQRERKRIKRTDGKPWTVGDLRERLLLMGVDVTEQTIRVWEGNSNRKPGPDALDALERIFGSATPDRSKSGDQSDLAGAIRELTEELRAMRQEREAMDIRVAALEALAALGAPSSGEGSPTPEPPRVEAGSGR